MPFGCMPCVPDAGGGSQGGARQWRFAEVTEAAAAFLVFRIAERHGKEVGGSTRGAGTTAARSTAERQGDATDMDRAYGDAEGCEMASRAEFAPAVACGEGGGRRADEQGRTAVEQFDEAERGSAESPLR